MEFIIKDVINKNNYCIWEKRVTFDDIWDTSCGETFILICDSPTNNNFNYCPYCGKILKELSDETKEDNK